MADLTQIPNKLDEEAASCRAIIETPRYCRSKFSYEPETGLFQLKAVLPEGMVFPFDFGFIPATEGGDGDPLDIMVLLDEPAHVGCLVDVRVVGAIEAKQTEKGKTEENHRLLGVSLHSRSHDTVRTPGDLGSSLLEQIEQWFVSYNKLRGKEFCVTGRSDPERALQLVREAMKVHSNRQAR